MSFIGEENILRPLIRKIQELSTSNAHNHLEENMNYKMFSGNWQSEFIYL